jgi:cytochrome b561
VTNHYWTRTAKSLHWIIAAAVLVLLALGAAFDRLDMYAAPDVAFYKAWMPLHKSLGLTVLLLMLLRWAWRATHGVPPYPASMSPLQQGLARWHHRVLYALLLLQPTLGLAQSSAYGAKTLFWGLFTVPSIIPAAWSRPATDVVRKNTQDLHAVIGWTIAVLVLLHVSAALYHHLVRRDSILSRMLPGGQPPAHQVPDAP